MAVVLLAIAGTPAAWGASGEWLVAGRSTAMLGELAVGTRESRSARDDTVVVRDTEIRAVWALDRRVR